MQHRHALRRGPRLESHNGRGGGAGGKNQAVHGVSHTHRCLPFQLRHQRISLLELQTTRRRWTGRTARGSPTIVGFQRLDHLVLASALLDQPGETIAHRLEVSPEPDTSSLVETGRIGDDGIESGSRCHRGSSSTEKAAALGVVDVDVDAPEAALGCRSAAPAWRPRNKSPVWITLRSGKRTTASPLVPSSNLLGTHLFSTSTGRFVGKRDARQADRRARRVLVAAA